MDQLVLSGCGDLLLDKKSTNPDTTIFLKELPNLLVFFKIILIFLKEIIDKIHQNIKDGNLTAVRNLITSKRLALARDRHGCTPLHTAIIYERSDIIRFIAANFSSILNAPDYVSFFNRIKNCFM